jgi:hypothetical protein
MKEFSNATGKTTTDLSKEVCMGIWQNNKETS